MASCRTFSSLNVFDYMLFLSSDESIDLMELLLEQETNLYKDYEYIKCTKSEGEDALLHRYVAGSAPARYQKIYSSKSGAHEEPFICDPPSAKIVFPVT